MKTSKNEEMKKSTKVLTYVFGAVLALSILAGLALGLGTMGSDNDSGSNQQEYSQTESMF